MKKMILDEVDSWFQYRRGLRPEDRPFYDGTCDAGIQFLDDEFLKTRLLASEGSNLIEFMDVEDFFLNVL
ncbi:MAG: hypothetical protein ACTSWX_01280 [Promethearchaeota archaeon]